MELTDSQYVSYVSDRLKLPPGKRTEYLKQIDTLIARFGKAAGFVPGLTIKKFLKTGSLQKGTVLPPAYGFGVDADIAVFIDIERSENVLSRLHEFLRALLIKVYPNKHPDDFKIQPRTLGIEFIESGLDVDLVPIIPIDGPGDYGWQPSSEGKPLLKTSVAGQLGFIRSYKERYANWTALVRLLKRWRNEQGLSELRSFLIELIVCYLQYTQGVPKDISDALSRFWLFLARDLQTTPVYFTASSGGQGSAISNGALVTVVDPVNRENNVASRISSLALLEITGAATKAWELHHEALTYSGKGATRDNIRFLFGTDFDFE